MSTPAVSVILCTYNRAPVLARAIRSVLAQTFDDFELIVVDDGSTDTSEQIVTSFDDPRLIYLKREHAGNVAALRNTGIRAARAPLIAIQDSDDEWLIDKLARQIDVLQNAGPDTGLICGGYLVLPVRGAARRVRPTQRMQSGDWDAGNIFHFSFIAPTWLARRQALEDAGGFDETLPNLEDWEFAFRLFQLTRIRVIDDPVLMKHGSADGLNAIKASRIASLQQIIERHGGLWEQHPHNLASLHNELGRCQCMHGQMAAGRANLYRGLRLDATSPKRWLHWLTSFLGRRAYNRLLHFAAH